jgi:hypothetical protein
MLGIFKKGSLSSVLLISASYVARITGVSHWQQFSIYVLGLEEWLKW